MICILILKIPGRIDQPVFNRDIPVGIDVLRMHQSDHLLRLAAQQVIQFGIGPRGIIKLCFVNGEIVIIISMKTMVPAGFHIWREKQIARCITQVAQMNMMPGCGKFFRKIYKR